MQRWMPVLLVWIALVAPGCGDDDAGTETAGDGPATVTGPSGVGGPGVTVGIRNFAFEPQEIRISVGEEVTWRNDDTAEHTVAGKGVEDPPESDELGLDQTYTWRALQAGTVQYVCTIHPNMTGSIIVEE